MITVQADGVSWPLETFLDAYGFRRCEGEEPASCDRDAIRVETINRAGELAPARYASEVWWSDVLAFRPLPLTVGAASCRCCGEPSMNPDDDICLNCMDCDYGDY